MFPGAAFPNWNMQKKWCGLVTRSEFVTSGINRPSLSTQMYFNLNKMCTKIMRVSTDRFHSCTRFQVLLTITSQFWIDVQKFFRRSLSNSLHSVDRFKYPFTRRLISMFHTTFMLKFSVLMVLNKQIVYCMFKRVGIFCFDGPKPSVCVFYMCCCRG